MYIRNNSFVFGTNVVFFFLVSLLYVVYLQLFLKLLSNVYGVACAWMGRVLCLHGVPHPSKVNVQFTSVWV